MRQTVRRVAWAALSFALLCAAGAAVFFLLRPRPPHRDDLSTLLAPVDAAISAGSLDTARGALENIRLLPSSEEGLLRLLKRAQLVCSASGDYRLMADLAARAPGTSLGSAEVRAVAAYALLRAGRVAEAEKAASRRRLPPDVGDLLKGEITLRRGRGWKGSDALTRDLIALDGSRDPLAFSAAAVRTGDTRLSLDAALLFMEKGALAEAQQVVQKDLTAAMFDEPAAAISWDSGDSKTALDRLERLNAARAGRAEILFRLADCLQALGRGGEAEKALRAGLPTAPQLSWTPYANLGFFAARRGDLGSADRFLKDGLAFFPASRDLRIARASIAARAGREEEAIKILTGLLDGQPGDSEAALLLLDLQASTLSPEQNRARLWKLFNRVPAETAPFQLLCGALIGARDWEGASIAIQQHGEAIGAEDADLLLLRGMIAAMRGDSAGAEADFRRAASEQKDGRARYDLALLLVQKGNARSALQELSLAEDEHARSGSPEGGDAVLSRIAMLGGTARLLDGDEAGARTAFARALTLDPHNLRASLLLRKLEARMQ
jgi:tetratricopeptide (TPR) repeat protein